MSPPLAFLSDSDQNRFFRKEDLPYYDLPVSQGPARKQWLSEAWQLLCPHPWFLLFSRLPVSWEPQGASPAGWLPGQSTPNRWGVPGSQIIANFKMAAEHQPQAWGLSKQGFLGHCPGHLLMKWPWGCMGSPGPHPAGLRSGLTDKTGNNGETWDIRDHRRGLWRHLNQRLVNWGSDI